MPYDTRESIERAIITLTVKTLLAAGHKLSIDQTNDMSGDYFPITDASEANIDLLVNDQEYLYVDDDKMILLIGGNGWDIISDYSVSLEETLLPIIDLAIKQDASALG